MGPVVGLPNVGRILLETFDSLACRLLRESFVHTRLRVVELVDRTSLPLVVEGLGGRTIPRMLDGEEDLDPQAEEADIPGRSEEERDSFLKSEESQFRGVREDTN